MMFHKSNDIIREIKDESLNNTFDIVDCWIKDEGKYKLYIFTPYFETEEELMSKWERINSDVSLYFQGGLQSKIEIWNIYILMLVEEKVKSENRYFIEQNKFSSRKIIIDNVSKPLTETEIQNLIYEKLFNLKIELKVIDNNQETLESLLNEDYNSLFDLLSKDEEKPDFLLKQYLEVFK